MKQKKLQAFDFFLKKQAIFKPHERSEKKTKVQSTHNRSQSDWTNKLTKWNGPKGKPKHILIFSILMTKVSKPTDAHRSTATFFYMLSIENTLSLDVCMQCTVFFGLLFGSWIIPVESPPWRKPNTAASNIHSFQKESEKNTKQHNFPLFSVETFWMREKNISFAY